ncbi:unnamed protein product [Amoebophrya sp. A25]|nr:unnamed protein product [Amoebophrya sp. A25]|eukprot:GSA25T00006595001.1
MLGNTPQPTSKIPFALLLSCEDHVPGAAALSDLPGCRVLEFRLPDELSRSAILRRCLLSALPVDFFQTGVAGVLATAFNNRKDVQSSSAVLNNVYKQSSMEKKLIKEGSRKWQKLETIWKLMAEKTAGFSFADLECAAVRVIAALCSPCTDDSGYSYSDSEPDDSTFFSEVETPKLTTRAEARVFSTTNVKEDSLSRPNSSTSAKNLINVLSVIDAVLKEARACYVEQKGTQTNLVKLTRKDISWRDIGGMERAIEEIKALIEFPLSKGSERYFAGSKPRSGALLFGPPGTGKTLLARTVAAEQECTFISVKGPELLSMYIGESEHNIRKVFLQAREAVPAVMFFDELDSLAPARGTGSDSGGVMDRVVTALTTELDDMPPKLFLLAATNRPDLLDNGLLRPGRLDRKIYLGINREDKYPVLSACCRNFVVRGDEISGTSAEKEGSKEDTSKEAVLREVAKTLPPEMSPADIAGLAQTAAVEALGERVAFIQEDLCGGDEKRVTGLLLRIEAHSTAVASAGSDDLSTDMWNRIAEHVRGVKVEREEEYTQAAKQALAQALLRVDVGKSHLLQAAASTVCSVTAKDLERYEALRKEYENI